MALSMPCPYRHPRSGVFWLRWAVPRDLRDAIGKTEQVVSLDTTDPAEARERAAEVMVRWTRQRASASGRGALPTGRDIAALCGEWHRQALADWGNNPEAFGDPDIYLDLIGDRYGDVEDGEDPSTAPVRLRPEDRAEAAALLQDNGFRSDDATASRLAEALLPTKIAFGHLMQRRAAGDWAPDATAERYPPLVAPGLPAGPPQVSPKGITIPDLIAAWAKESGTAGKALYDRERTGKMLASFLGHDDASRVSADDVVRWKEDRLAQGRSTKTVANDIGELRPIWTWGKRNRKLAFGENPFAGLAPRAPKDSRSVRDPFNDADAVRILEAARKETDASLRWLPCLAAFTGARIGELAQSAKEDAQRHDGNGPWFLHVHRNGPGRTLKNAQSERMIPLHPALITEGFLDYVARLPAGSPLFPDLKPDKFGRRAGTATKKHGRWVRKTVGIADPRKDPAHAWRHRFKDACRRVKGMPREAIDALMGHKNPANEGESYGRGYRFMPEETAAWVAQIANPLAHSKETCVEV